jgi:hypothetical protein
MIKPEEAWLLFDKWHTEASPLLCIGLRFDVSFVLQGTIVLLSRQELTVTGLEKGASITLGLEQDLEFEYREPKDVPVPAPNNTVATLAVHLPLRVTLPLPLVVPKRETIFFLELSKPVGEK